MNAYGRARAIARSLPILLGGLLAASAARADVATFQQGVGGYSTCRAVDITDWNLTPPGGFADNGTTHGDGDNDWVIGRLHGHPGFGFDASPLIRFDGLSLPAGAVLQSATLRLRLTTFEAGARVIGRYLNRAWNATFVYPPGGTNAGPVGWRWSDKPSQLWSALGAQGEGSDVIAVAQFSFPEGAGTLPPIGEQVVTSALDPAIVAQWIASPATNHGIKLQVEATGIAVTLVPPQRTGAADRHPLLTIVYSVPVAVPPEAMPATIQMTAAPNPASGTIEIRWHQPQAGRATLDVFDVSGRRVAVLLDRNLDAGPHAVQWQDRTADPGLYFCRVTAAGTSAVVRIARAR